MRAGIDSVRVHGGAGLTGAPRRLGEVLARELFQNDAVSGSHFA
jgi:hypothetical protein